MVSSQNNSIVASSQHEDEKKIITMRWLKHLRHRYIRLSEDGIFHCDFCGLHLSNTDSLLDHMLQLSHFSKVMSDKKSVLKEKNRWPFLDGIALFDYDCSEDFTNPEDDVFFGKMVDYRMGLLQRVVDDDMLNIPPYYYGDVRAVMKEEDTGIKVLHHKVYKSLGKMKISLRCNVSYYIDAYGKDVKVNKFDFLYGIWAEWEGLKGGNQAVEKDAGNTKYVDPLEVSMIVMPYRRNLGIVQGSTMDTDEPKFCFICDKEMILGKDVASLLANIDPGTAHAHASASQNIKCCNFRQVLARRKRTGDVKTNDGTIMQPNALEVI